jgi:hypothetical protein
MKKDESDRADVTPACPATQAGYPLVSAPHSAAAVLEGDFAKRNGGWRGKSVAKPSRAGHRPGRPGHYSILRNEVGGTGDGGHNEALDFALDGGLFVVLPAAGVLADGGAEALEFGEGFVEGTLGGGAVAEHESQSGGVERFEIKDGELEFKGATHAPLAEGHLLEQHTLGFGRGFPFLVELGADGVKFFEIGAGKSLCLYRAQRHQSAVRLGAEIVLGSVAGGNGLTFFGGRASGGSRFGDRGYFDCGHKSTPADIARSRKEAEGELRVSCAGCVG